MKDKSSILRKSIKMGSVEHETKVSNKEGIKNKVENSKGL